MIKTPTLLHKTDSLSTGFIDNPPVSTVYLHLTQRCNLSCCYCYSDAGSKGYLGLDTDHLERVLLKILKLQPLRIVMTGGEPLLRNDLGELACFIRRRSPNTKICLNTNGTLFTASNVSILGRLFDEIRISIDGFEETNDTLRGRGTFKLAVHSIEELRNIGITPSIAFTLTRTNSAEAEFFIQFFCVELGIRSVRINPLKPLGRSIQRPDLLLQEGNLEIRSGKSGILARNPCNGYTCVGTTVSVTPDGLAFPCHWLTQGNCCVGDLRVDDPQEVLRHLQTLRRNFAETANHDGRKLEEKTLENC